jgi:hypothetical protein
VIEGKKINALPKKTVQKKADEGAPAPVAGSAPASGAAPASEPAAPEAPKA